MSLLMSNIFTYLIFLLILYFYLSYIFTYLILLNNPTNNIIIQMGIAKFMATDKRNLNIIKTINSISIEIRHPFSPKNE